MSIEQFFDVITSGLDRYKRWCLQSRDELPSRRVGSEYIFPNCDVDQEKLAEISEELMFLIENRILRYCWMRLSR